MSQVEKLRGYMKDFTVQSVLGCYLNVLQLYKLDNSEIVEKTCSNVLKYYLNLCYHDYHKKTDKYVVNMFDNIFSCNIIKGTVCLIHWCNCFGEMLLHVSRIPESEIKELSNREIIISTLKPLLMHGFDIYIAKKLTADIKCQGNCDDDYDGLDVFQMNALEASKNDEPDTVQKKTKKNKKTET